MTTATRRVDNRSGRYATASRRPGRWVRLTTVWRTSRQRRLKARTSLGVWLVMLGVGYGREHR